MQYSRLGNTGLIVSKACFGAMTFGTSEQMPTINKVDQQLAQSMINRCFEAGINFFDTANGYANGQSELMLGQLLGARRQDIVLATKVGFRQGQPITHAGLSRRHIFDACEASLKRLNTDYIDLYIVHKEDIFTPLEETLNALNDLVRSGKVRYLGFSNWSAWKAATALQLQKANGWAEFTSGQMYYSLLGRDVEHEIVPFMQYAGVGMTVWSPLASGFLSGKYTRENLKDSDNRYSGFDMLPFDKEFAFSVVEKIRSVAERRQTSVAQVALAWLLAKPVVSSLIIGASKLAQLDDNLAALDLKLTPEDVAELDNLTATAAIYPNWFNTVAIDTQHRDALA